MGGGPVLGVEKIGIAVVHLPPLPGSPGFCGGRRDFESIVEFAVREARVLEECGADAVLIENFGDKPFEKRVSDPVTTASMAVIVREVVKSVSIPVGVNILRNSAIEALAVAMASGARFVRVNAFVETLATDSGIIEPAAPSIARYLARHRGLGSEIAILADVLCKHATPIAFPAWVSSLEEYLDAVVRDAVERGGANALIVTGRRTGEPPSPRLVEAVKERARETPVLLGSGATPENLPKFLRVCDGVIVGSYVKVGGGAGNPTDPERARKFFSELRRLRSRG